MSKLHIHSIYSYFVQKYMALGIVWDHFQLGYLKLQYSLLSYLKLQGIQNSWFQIALV